MKLHLSISVPMIIGEIRRYLRDNNSIRVSRTIRDIAYKALKIKEDSMSETVSNKDIADKLNVDVQTIDEAMRAISEPFSIYDNIFSDSDDNSVLLDQLKDDNSIEERWVEDISLVEAIKRLNDKEKEIINLRYYKGKTQIEVAEEIGISQAQVSRIEKCALSNIKKEMC